MNSFTNLIFLELQIKNHKSFIQNSQQTEMKQMRTYKNDPICINQGKKAKNTMYYSFQKDKSIFK